MDRVRARARLGPGPGGALPPPLDGPWPFAELLRPFLAVFEAEVDRRCPGARALLGPAARDAVRRDFLAALVELCLPTLELRFTVHRALALPSPTPDCTVQYRRFVAECLDDGFQGWMADYPELGPTCARLLEARSAATAEYLHRYRTDRPLLAQALGLGRDPGPIVDLELGLSDPHRGGRSVVRFSTASGASFYYHPKDLGLFSGFNALLGWINARGNPTPLQQTRCLQRPGYGWMAPVPHRPCPDAGAVGRYYERAGQLLCLAYLLNGTDLHQENLICSGEHPVLIDLETLLQPELDPELFALLAQAPGRGLLVTASPGLEDLVLGTLLLPRWELSAAGTPVDASGLGQGLQGQARRLAWAHPAADGLHRTWVEVAVSPAPSQVFLDGRPVRVRNHPEALARGFTWMYHFLIRHREVLGAPDGPLQALKGQPGRLLFRFTQAYVNLLHKLALPAGLRAAEASDPADAASHPIQGLARCFRPLGEAHPLWPLHQEEVRALHRRDVPYFSCISDRRHWGGEEAPLLPDALARSGFEILLQRLADLDERDLARQLIYIRGSLTADGLPEATPDTAPMAEPLVESLHGPMDAPGAGTRDPAGAPEPGRFLPAALAVAERLRLMAITSRRSPGATWIGLRFLGTPRVGILAPLDRGLYQGQAGVALFLAALDATPGGAGYRDLALAALQPLRPGAEGTARHAELSLGEGGALVYALTRCAGWLELPEALEAAASAALSLTRARIQDDLVLDVLGGSAGACLGLLALHRASPEDRWLDLAMACGDQLLAQQRPGPGAARAWLRPGTAILAGGFAHGAAGMGYALLRLFLATGAERYRQAAESAYALEQALFDPTRGRWADQWPTPAPTAEGKPPDPWCAWCHGAAGIGLAWTGALGCLAGAAAQVAAAVADVRRCGPAPLPYLCCGTAGRADLLFTAGQRLERPEWAAEAMHLAATTLDRQPAPFGLGEFQTAPLMQGATGCAYQGLRLASGGRLPSLLLWE